MPCVGQAKAKGVARNAISYSMLLFCVSDWDLTMSLAECWDWSLTIQHERGIIADEHVKGKPICRARMCVGRFLHFHGFSASFVATHAIRPGKVLFACRLARICRTWKISSPSIPAAVNASCKKVGVWHCGQLQQDQQSWWFAWGRRIVLDANTARVPNSDVGF